MTDVTEPHTQTHPSRPPETGDIVIDAALRDLDAAHDDLTLQLRAGEAVQTTLQSRLRDLGG